MDETLNKLVLLKFLFMLIAIDYSSMLLHIEYLIMHINLEIHEVNAISQLKEIAHKVPCTICILYTIHAQ